MARNVLASASCGGILFLLFTPSFFSLLLLLFINNHSQSNIIKVLQALGVSKLSPNTRAKFLRYILFFLSFFFSVHFALPPFCCLPPSTFPLPPSTFHLPLPPSPFPLPPSP